MYYYRVNKVSQKFDANTLSIGTRQVPIQDFFSISLPMINSFKRPSNRVSYSERVEK